MRTPALAPALALACALLIVSRDDADRAKYDIAWVEDRNSPVDTINGFIEVYLAPRGIKGAWEGLVFYVNAQNTTLVGWTQPRPLAQQPMDTRDAHIVEPVDRVAHHRVLGTRRHEVRRVVVTEHRERDQDSTPEDSDLREWQRHVQEAAERGQEYVTLRHNGADVESWPQATGWTV